MQLILLASLLENHTNIILQLSIGLFVMFMGLYIKVGFMLPILHFIFMSIWMLTGLGALRLVDLLLDGVCFSIVLQFHGNLGSGQLF